MTGAEQVRAALAQKLEEAGITTVAAWERMKIPQLTGTAAVLGVQETESDSAALWNYLGEQWDDENGAPVERYGRKLRLALYIDFYAPKVAAGEIEKCCQTLEEILISDFTECIRTDSVQRGEISYDSISGYLKCRCTVSCAAYFTATRVEEGALLTDFTLKGVLA